jgi:diaminopropionate ammonia-lyase
LAGLIEAMKDQKISEAMELNNESIVLLFGTEGATDPEIYHSFVSG